MSTSLSQRLFRLRLTSSSQVFADHCFLPRISNPVFVFLISLFFNCLLFSLQTFSFYRKMTCCISSSSLSTILDRLFCYSFGVLNKVLAADCGSSDPWNSPGFVLPITVKPGFPNYPHSYLLFIQLHSCLVPVHWSFSFCLATRRWSPAIRAVLMMRWSVLKPFRDSFRSFSLLMDANNLTLL